MGPLSQKFEGFVRWIDDAFSDKRPNDKPYGYPQTQYWKFKIKISKDGDKYTMELEEAKPVLYLDYGGVKTGWIYNLL